MQRLLGAPFRLHDVRDVENFCSAIIAKALRTNGGTLRYDQHRRALTDTVSLAWHISGLDAQGKRRVGWVVQAWVTVDDEETREPVLCRLRNLVSEPTEERAQLVLEKLAPRYLRPMVVRMSPPPGCYDPRKSQLSFSTFATSILTKRLVDWYRVELGDDRYGERLPVLSLDELREREDRRVFAEELDDGFLYDQSLTMTRLTLATTVPFVSPLEELEEANRKWDEHVASGEVAVA